MNHVRAMFSNWLGRIEQEDAQSNPSPVERRAREFEATTEIIDEAIRVGLVRR